MDRFRTEGPGLTARPSIFEIDARQIGYDVDPDRSFSKRNPVIGGERFWSQFGTGAADGLESGDSPSRVLLAPVDENVKVFGLADVPVIDHGPPADYHEFDLMPVESGHHSVEIVHVGVLRAVRTH